MFRNFLFIITLLTLSCTPSIELVHSYKVCGLEEAIVRSGFHLDSICGKQYLVFAANNCYTTNDAIRAYKQYMALNPISSLCAQDHYIFYGWMSYSPFYTVVGDSWNADESNYYVPLAFEYSHNIQLHDKVYTFTCSGQRESYLEMKEDSISLLNLLGTDALRYRDSVCICKSIYRGYIEECDSSMLYAKPVEQN